MGQLPRHVRATVEETPWRVGGLRKGAGQHGRAGQDFYNEHDMVMPMAQAGTAPSTRTP